VVVLEYHWNQTRHAGAYLRVPALYGGSGMKEPSCGCFGVSRNQTSHVGAVTATTCLVLILHVEIIFS
jgi:hypothetical protein